MLRIFLQTSLLINFILGQTILANPWIPRPFQDYTLYYRSGQEVEIPGYAAVIQFGMNQVDTFFRQPFRHSFDVYLHLDRHSLDSTWQSDWGMPGFHSECWMVASGVANRLDLLSPKQWDSLSCEHHSVDTLATQQLITHELVHVFHGQYNPSPDFSEVSGIDWLVEGLAVYASGQCDALRLAAVKEAIVKNELPEHLTDFWTGNLRYGLAGSMVRYIDRHYGRERLYELLSLTNLPTVLTALDTDEQTLLQDWQDDLSGR